MFNKNRNMLNEKKEPKIKLLLSAEVAIMSDTNIKLEGVRENLTNAFDSAQANFKGVLRTLLNINNYGDGILFFGIVQIIGPKKDLEEMGWIEIKKYTPKEQEVEIRLKVDYEKFVKSGGEWDAIYENIIDSLEAMKEIVPSTFDTDKLIKDFKKACVGLF